MNSMQKLSADQKQTILNELMGSAAGRVKIASSLIQPLRFRRDYTSVARKAFIVEQLPDGAQSMYDKDPDVFAYIVGEEGENIVTVVKTTRFVIPTFEIASNPEIPLSQLKQRRFDMIERAIDKSKSEIQAIEDEYSFGVMDATADGAAGADPDDDFKNVDIPVTAPLNSSILADAFASIERHDLRVARIFMNARDYTDIRKWGRDTLDFETQQYLLNTGLLAHVWGAQIIVSRKVPVGTVYVCTESEFFGRIPVRTELTVISADDPRNRLIAFSLFEDIGVGVHNPRGLVRMQISRG